MLRRSGAIAALTVLAVAACSEAPTRALVTPTDALLGIRPPTTRPPGSTVRTAQKERLELCKDYAEGSEAPALTDFSVVVSGGTTASFTIQLTPGECAEIWANGAVTPDYVTITETVPQGFSAAWERTTMDKNGATTSASGSGNVATATVGGTNIPGALIVFTNTPVPSLQGRMTGGGFRTGNVKVTGGFTLHCDIKLSNNLQIVWDKNTWHLDKPITKAYCTDDPNIAQAPPAAPFDTFIGEGYGRLNGVDGSLIKFTLVDAGEPGRDDMVKLQIFAPDGALVLDLPLGKLDIGNIQAHYDQPHGQKP